MTWNFGEKWDNRILKFEWGSWIISLSCNSFLPSPLEVWKILKKNDRRSRSCQPLKTFSHLAYFSLSSGTFFIGGKGRERRSWSNDYNDVLEKKEVGPVFILRTKGVRATIRTESHKPETAELECGCDGLPFRFSLFVQVSRRLWQITEMNSVALALCCKNRIGKDRI